MEFVDLIQSRRSVRGYGAAIPHDDLVTLLTRAQQAPSWKNLQASRCYAVESPEALAALRAQGCQIVIVSYHWGEEKDYVPNERQVPLGRATIDAGADLVIGHHSHRINPIEVYKGKYICYSLGNFSFAGNTRPDDMDTFIFQQRL